MGAHGRLPDRHPVRDARQEGFEEPARSRKVLSSSGEVHDLVAGGVSMARDLVVQGRGMPVDRIQPGAARLHRVA